MPKMGTQEVKRQNYSTKCPHMMLGFEHSFLDTRIL
jgi:hypothetical protein